MKNYYPIVLNHYMCFLNCQCTRSFEVPSPNIYEFQYFLSLLITILSVFMVTSASPSICTSSAFLISYLFSITFSRSKYILKIQNSLKLLLKQLKTFLSHINKIVIIFKNQVKEMKKHYGSMAELVDAPDSKSGHFGGVGSIPSTPTK